MDFLDSLAYLLTPNSKKHSSGKKTESDEKESAPAVSKLQIQPTVSYAEKNFVKPTKIYNDKYKKSPFHLSFGERFSLDVILPFLNKKQNWADWTYRNRYGIYTTLGLYLAILFGFSMLQFEVGGDTIPQGILIELEKEKLEIKEEEQEERKSLAEDFESELYNEISDENSMTKKDYQSNIAGDSPVKLKMRLADLLDDEVARHMFNYRETMNRIDKETEQESRMAKAKRDSLEQERKKNEGTFSHKKGNVTVSFNLEGRDAMYLEIPAYLCEGGGKVVVEMEVNRSGKVVRAAVKSTQSVTDPCVEEMAVWATKLAEFDVKNDAPERQKGTMTYIFRAQQ